MNNYVDILKDRHEKEAFLEHIHLSDTVATVLDSIKSLVESSQTKVHMDFSEIDHVQFNTSYLESIFLNLITNAIRYSKPGIEPEIRIFSQQHQGQTQVVVQDRGLGMDLEKIENRIF